MRAGAAPDTAQAVHPSPPLTSDPDAKCRLWRSIADSAESSAFLPPSSEIAFRLSIRGFQWPRKYGPLYRLLANPSESEGRYGRFQQLLQPSSLFPSRPTPLPRNALFSSSGVAAGAEAVTALLAGGPSGLLAVPLLWTSLLGPIL